MRKGGSSSILGPVLCSILIALPRALAQHSHQYHASSCYTPNNLTGTCISILECKPLLELLEEKPLLSASTRFLRESQCGFEDAAPQSMPKVCCGTDSQSDDLEPPNVTRHPHLRILEHENCGLINHDRIFGGRSAGLFEFPWMALLAYRTKYRTVEFRCGGSVISRRYILTATHCVTNLQSNTSLMGVRVGEYDTSRQMDCINGGTFEEYCAEMYQDFNAEEVIPHPEYSPTTMHNDIALIRVDRDIDFRPANAKPICLPIGSVAKLTRSKLVVTGWGLYESRIPSPVLMKVTLPRVPQEDCVATYARKLPIWHKQLCMSGKQGMDVCTGDSGGPLQAPIVDNRSVSRFVQYGIVSFGHSSCGVEGFPGVYTRLEFYMDWLLDNLRD